MSPENTSHEPRIVELESRLVFQEQTIETLHEVLYRQQLQLDALTTDLARLHRRLQETLPDQEKTDPAHG